MKTNLMILKGIRMIIVLLMDIKESITGSRYSFEEEYDYCMEIHRKLREEELKDLKEWGDD